MDIITTSQKFENKELQKVTNEIQRVGVSIRQNFYKLAGLLKRVETERLFVDDGFMSVSEYAEKTFGIKKTTTYNLIKIAGSYLGKTGKESNLPHTGTRDYSSSQLNALLPLDEDTVRQLANDGDIYPEMSVRDMKKVIKLYKEEPEAIEIEEETTTDDEPEAIPYIFEIRAYKDEAGEVAIETVGNIPIEISNAVHDYFN